MKNLLIATVLLGALSGCALLKPSGMKLFHEAEEWFLEKDSESLFSFESICETLGLHPDYIRQGLLVWKEAKLKLNSVETPMSPSGLIRPVLYLTYKSGATRQSFTRDFSARLH